MASSFLALLLPESRESPIANSIIGHAQASSLQHAPQRGRETTVSIPASMSWRCESPDIDIANGGQLMLAIDLRVRTRKELAKASARGSTARLLDEQVTLKRRKR